MKTEELIDIISSRVAEGNEGRQGAVFLDAPGGAAGSLFPLLSSRLTRERPGLTLVYLDEAAMAGSLPGCPVLNLMRSLALRLPEARRAAAMKEARLYGPHVRLLEAYLAGRTPDRREELIPDECAYELALLREGMFRLLGCLAGGPLVVLSEGMERIGPTEAALFPEWFLSERTGRQPILWVAGVDFAAAGESGQKPEYLQAFMDEVRSGHSLLSWTPERGSSEANMGRRGPPAPRMEELKTLFQLLYLKEAQERGERIYREWQSSGAEQDREAAFEALLIQVASSHFLAEEEAEALRADELVEAAADLKDRSLRSRALRAASTLELARNSYEAALRFASLARAAAESSGDPAERALADLALFTSWETTFITFERTPEYEELFDALSTQFGRLKMHAHLAFLYSRTIHLMHIFRTRGPEPAIGACRMGLRYALRIKNRFRLSIAWQAMGLLQQTWGDGDAAHSAYRKALRIMEGFGRPTDLARIHNSIGFFHFAGGAYPESLRSYRKALSFLSRTDEYEEICTTAVNIAYVYVFSSGWRMAVEYLDQALRMMGRIGLVDLRYHPAHYIWALLGMASVRDGKMSRALEMVERIEARCGKDPDGRQEYYWFCRAQMARASGDADAAARCFERTLSICLELEPETRHIRLFCLEEYATAFLEAGRTEEARKIAKRSLTEIPRDGLNDSRRRRLEALVGGQAPGPEALPEKEFDFSPIYRSMAQKAVMANLQGKMLHIRFLNSLQAKVNADITPREIVAQAASLIAATFVNDTCLAVIRSERDESEGLPELAALETIHPLGGLEPGQRELLCECLAVMGSREDRIPEAWRVTSRESSWHSLLCVVIRAFARPWGFVVIALGRTDSSYTEDDERILALASRQATLAVELKMTALRLQVAASTDGLTGVLNRNEVLGRVEAEFARAKRYRAALKGPFSILFLDLDDFKRWNDGYGHQAGDILLRWIARVLKDCTREVDVIGRYGGDEFLVLLPETGAEAAGIVASRILERLGSAGGLEGFAGEEGKQTFPSGIALKPSCSIGIAQVDGEASQGLDGLLARADQALYEAKQAGKGRVATG